MGFFGKFFKEVGLYSTKRRLIKLCFTGEFCTFRPHEDFMVSFLNPKVGVSNMAGGTPKREEKHPSKIPMVSLGPLVPNKTSLAPGRPSLVPSTPVVASLAQIVQQADSAPLETLRNESTFLPKVA